jgi:hypothetical protein
LGRDKSVTTLKGFYLIDYQLDINRQHMPFDGDTWPKKRKMPDSG